jgi:anaerobic magnesium-protoporphyrin IX monomethyl ester cyclase
VSELTKILFLNPVIREREQPRHVPYGELLVATCAEKWFDAKVAMLDLNALRSILTEKQLDEELLSAIQEEDWTLIGIGGITTTYSSIKRTLKIIRPLTDALIILGGGGFTAQPYEWMTWLREADLGCLGEAVQTIGEVIKHSQDQQFNEVRGSVWRDHDNLVTNSEPRPLVDLDSLPLPNYDLAPLDIYFKNSSLLFSEESMLAKRRLDYVASQGCSFSCSFCYDLGLTGFKLVGREVHFPRSHPNEVPRKNRWRSPRKCVEDWKFMKEKYGCDFITLLDENAMTMNALSPSRDWLEQISELVIQEGLQPQCVRDGQVHDPKKCEGLHFGTTGHASLTTPRILRAMRRMGFSYIDIGFESWDDRILKDIRKGSTLRANVRSLKMIMHYGIRSIPNNITGMEIEDFESIRRMMVAWRSLGIVVEPFLFCPYPGSDAYYRNKKKILADYGGDLELFVKTLNDATEPVVSVSRNFTLEEILIYRFHMARGDRDAIDSFENVWRAKRNLPPRTRDEQQADWEQYASDIQKHIDEAEAEASSWN